jgi:hypothetical protein
MIQANRNHAVEIPQLSFKGTVDTLRQFSLAIAQARSLKKQRN